MITILMKYHGHTLQSAVDYVGDLCHQTINEFVQNTKNVPHWGPEVDDMVKRYIRGLEDWMVGYVLKIPPERRVLNGKIEPFIGASILHVTLAIMEKK